VSRGWGATLFFIASEAGPGAATGISAASLTRGALSNKSPPRGLRKPGRESAARILLAISHPGLATRDSVQIRQGPRRSYVSRNTVATGTPDGPVLPIIPIGVRRRSRFLPSFCGRLSSSWRCAHIRCSHAPREAFEPFSAHPHRTLRGTDETLHLAARAHAEPPVAEGSHRHGTATEAPASIVWSGPGGYARQSPPRLTNDVAARLARVMEQCEASCQRPLAPDTGHRSALSSSYGGHGRAPSA
jgi:hypothetical protein